MNGRQMVLFCWYFLLFCQSEFILKRYRKHKSEWFIYRWVFTQAPHPWHCNYSIQPHTLSCTYCTVSSDILQNFCPQNLVSMTSRTKTSFSYAKIQQIQMFPKQIVKKPFNSESLHRKDLYQSHIRDRKWSFLSVKCESKGRRRNKQKPVLISPIPIRRSTLGDAEREK
jgi:hypothetical protein